MSHPFLVTENLGKNFPIRGGIFSRKVAELKAVIDVNLKIPKGKTLGLVGESGCGKSTLGRCLVRLLKPSGGRILIDRKDISSLVGLELLALRRKIQIIFQDPYASLNPRMTVEDIVMEPLSIHHSHLSKAEKRTRVKELMDLCGLRAESLNRYPHEFSGGQRQRICIARALSVSPEFIVCDEAVSALDVSIQAQIINLLMQLQKEFNLTYLFISHDLGVVRHICDEVAVMYLGRIIERGPTEEIFGKTLHPYTKSLMSAIPEPCIPQKRKRIRLPGDVPSPISPPSGCAFHPRCFKATEECRRSRPFLEIKEATHEIACFHASLD